MGKNKKRTGTIPAVASAILLLLLSIGMFVWWLGSEEKPPKSDVGVSKNNESEETWEETSPDPLETGDMQESTDRQESVDEDLKSKIEVTVTSLSFGSTDGSCVVWEKQGETYFLLTASHVVSGDGETVRLAEQNVTVNGYWQSPDYDLAFLKVECEQGGMSGLQPVLKVADEESGLQAGDEIRVCGVAASEKYLLTGKVLEPWVYMEDFGYHMLWGEVKDTKGGMSGGGVFDSRGRLVGILLGSDGDSQIAVLPLAIIEGEWSNCDLAGTLDISSN